VTTAPAGIVCRNSECRFSETGKCLEGFTIEDCPQIAKDLSTMETSEVEESLPVDKLEEPEDIALPKSERLSLDDASEILRAGPTVVVTVVGPTASGKTSLIASLCDLYQMGQVGTWQFARARTLFAFEQACHDARAASLHNAPTTEHTPVGSGVGFYHLALKTNSAPDALNLLMADRSGEEYQSVQDDPLVAKDFFEVHRANLITILVNGELLLDIGARHNVKHEPGMILEGLINANATSPNQRVALVLTKFDTIARASSSDEERAERDFEAINLNVQKAFSESFSEIRPFKIAASPSEADCAYGYGVEALLMFWMTPELALPAQKMVLPRPARAMSRFANLRT
jgi:hypothetical protein